MERKKREEERGTFHLYKTIKKRWMRTRKRKNLFIFFSYIFNVCTRIIYDKIRKNKNIIDSPDLPNLFLRPRFLDHGILGAVEI